MDIVCRTNSDTGKTAVFVLATLYQLNPSAFPRYPSSSFVIPASSRDSPSTLLARSRHYRFLWWSQHQDQLWHPKEWLSSHCCQNTCTYPWAKEKTLKLDHIKHFVLDKCDHVLKSLDMSRDIQEIYRMTPHEKQEMMFIATLSKEIRPVCKKFCQDPMEI